MHAYEYACVQTAQINTIIILYFLCLNFILLPYETSCAMCAQGMKTVYADPLNTSM